MFSRAVAAVFAAVVIHTEPVGAQQPQDLVRELNRSGPRFGITWLAGSIVDTLRTKYDVDVAPIITQFGWQY